MDWYIQTLWYNKVTPATGWKQAQSLWRRGHAQTWSDKEENLPRHSRAPETNPGQIMFLLKRKLISKIFLYNNLKNSISWGDQHNDCLDYVVTISFEENFCLWMFLGGVSLDSRRRQPCNSVTMWFCNVNVWNTWRADIKVSTVN